MCSPAGMSTHRPGDSHDRRPSSAFHDPDRAPCESRICETGAYCPQRSRPAIRESMRSSLGDELTGRLNQNLDDFETRDRRSGQELHALAVRAERDQPPTRPTRTLVVGLARARRGPCSGNLRFTQNLPAHKLKTCDAAAAPRRIIRRAWRSCLRVAGEVRCAGSAIGRQHEQ